MNVSIVEGDLLDQKVDAIVNAWNRNIIPWWLLWPHGVSGAIKKRGGLEPFREIGRCGPIPLGQARLTGTGKLPFKGIIHVAGINGWWRASERSIRGSVVNAMNIVEAQKFDLVAFPVIGAGAGGFDEDQALGIMREAFLPLQSTALASIVRFRARDGRS
jgi:O-acetyl-ADP-ribose deacetylase (regulator of RNase III)